MVDIQLAMHETIEVFDITIYKFLVVLFRLFTEHLLTTK